MVFFFWIGRIKKLKFYMRIISDRGDFGMMLIIIKIENKNLVLIDLYLIGKPLL